MSTVVVKPCDCEPTWVFHAVEFPLSTKAMKLFALVAVGSVCTALAVVRDTQRCYASAKCLVLQMKSACVHVLGSKLEMFAFEILIVFTDWIYIFCRRTVPFRSVTLALSGVLFVNSAEATGKSKSISEGGIGWARLGLLAAWKTLGFLV